MSAQVSSCTGKWEQKEANFKRPTADALWNSLQLPKVSGYVTYDLFCSRQYPFLYCSFTSFN